MENTYPVAVLLFTCDETIDVEAKLNDEETKTVPTN